MWNENLSKRLDLFISHPSPISNNNNWRRIDVIAQLQLFASDKHCKKLLWFEMEELEEKFYILNFV